MLGCNEDIKLSLSDVEVISITLGDADRIKFCDNEGSELGSSDGSFDSSDYGNFEGSLLGDSLGSDIQPKEPSSG